MGYTSLDWVIADDNRTDELDSHLYQSVGTSLLPYLARAMSLPLFSRVIKGKAVSRGAEYGSRIRGGDGSGEEGDETEDLTALLRQVMVGHPLLPAETMPDVSGP